VFFVAMWNLPPGNAPQGGSAIRRGVMSFASPVLLALGLDQGWGVFAPPRTTSIALSAVVNFSDGTSATWVPPTSTGALFGEYRDYRWGKYVENLIAYQRPVQMFQFSLWLARRYNRPGRRPILVKLIQLVYALQPITNANAQPAPGAPAVGAGPLRRTVMLAMPILPFMLVPGYGHGSSAPLQF
jgi:hypothetical protein